jgi:hypothetical protein
MLSASTRKMRSSEVAKSILCEKSIRRQKWSSHGLVTESMKSTRTYVEQQTGCISLKIRLTIAESKSPTFWTSIPGLGSATLFTSHQSPTSNYIRSEGCDITLRKFFIFVSAFKLLIHEIMFTDSLGFVVLALSQTIGRISVRSCITWWTLG